MIPYFQYNAFQIGPLTIQVWGLMVALGIMAGALLMTHLAKKYLLSAEVSMTIAIWAIVGSVIGARLFHVIFYQLDYYLLNPGEVIKFWHGGLSSLGGFVGALAAVWLVSKRRHFRLSELLPYLDIGSVSLWLGWGIGRIGCFLIHDHPGTLSHFILAVKYPGGARHDLGLYESLLGFILFILFIFLFKGLIKKGWGYVVGLSCVAYAIVRFFLDFLRVADLPGSDVRYFHLTPAQWGMLAVVLFLTLSRLWSKLKPLQVNSK